MIPGGVNSPVRAMRAVGREPLFMRAGAGAEIEDVDGNRYVDYVCSWGPLILGHAHPAVVEAVTAAARRGTSYGAPTEAEVELAEEVVARVPSAEMVRLVSSGTEASMTARAACARGHRPRQDREVRRPLPRPRRRAAGRVRLRARDAGHSRIAGRDRGAGRDTVVVPWNDAEALRGSDRRRQLAAVLAEPIPANMGLVSRAQRASSSCCATRATRPVRCWCSTR